MGLESCGNPEQPALHTTPLATIREDRAVTQIIWVWFSHRTHTPEFFGIWMLRYLENSTEMATYRLLHIEQHLESEGTNKLTAIGRSTKLEFSQSAKGKKAENKWRRSEEVPPYSLQSDPSPMKWHKIISVSSAKECSRRSLRPFVRKFRCSLFI